MEPGISPRSSDGSAEAVQSLRSWGLKVELAEAEFETGALALSQKGHCFETGSLLSDLF